jgi:hypothetical protein
VTPSACNAPSLVQEYALSLIRGVKKMVRQFVPQAVLEQRRQLQQRAVERDFAGKSLQEAFSAIYRRGLWGRVNEDGFYSGVGSHDPRLVDDYVSAVCAFLAALPQRPHAVDLGCGDFNVGRRLRPMCDRYVACDVVPELVERNRARFPDAEFRCLDIVRDALPAGDVAFLRQVLQHLGNEQISRVLPKLAAYRFVVITEHLPDLPEFPANIDKPTGHHIRLDRVPPSGVVPTLPPFELQAASQRVLCETPHSGGIIRSTVYEMAPAADGG